jgi:hypothetical protein
VENAKKLRLIQPRWIPAFAGMTTFTVQVPGIVIPSKAGIHRSDWSGVRIAVQDMRAGFPEFPRPAWPIRDKMSDYDEMSFGTAPLAGR